MFNPSALVPEIVKLQKFAWRLTKNSADADDLVQSTCLRALEKSHHFEQGTNLFSWTSKIMFNLFISDYRRKTKFETPFDPEIFLAKESIKAAQDVDAEISDVKRAMMKLNPEHRQMLILICAQGMSYCEVSDMLQIPIGTVRSRLSRAREQLQIIMDKPSPEAAAQAMALQKPVNMNMPLIPAYIAAAALKKNATKL